MEKVSNNLPAVNTSKQTPPAPQAASDSAVVTAEARKDAPINLSHSLGQKNSTNENFSAIQALKADFNWHHFAGAIPV